MLFIHDHTFVVRDGNYYTTGSLNQRIMDRYRDWFGNVSVFARKDKQIQDSLFVRSENLVKNIDFKLVPKKNSIIHIFKCAKQLGKAVREADCVVVRMSVFGAIGVYYARKYKVPYLVEMVACPWDSLWYHSIKGKILAPFMTLITKNICRKAPRILYVTNEFLQKKYPCKGITIGCSDVELVEMNEKSLSKRLKHIASREKNQPLKLCTVANVNLKYKGQEIVIRSLQDLNKAGIYCDYYLVGGGNPAHLQNVAKKFGVIKQIHIMGPKPHEEIFSILDDMDLYIQPSYMEGLPRSVIEAMSRACPVIGSSAGGIPELISDEFVFKRGDIQGFKRIMLRNNIENMRKQAILNFKKAKDYEKTNLDKKRNDFYCDFVNEVKNQ